MPCSDVTEILEVILDGDENLLDYSFNKRTCGQGIGVANLIIDQLRGRPLNELLFITAEDFLGEFTIPDPTEEFLSLKHLFAIQGALEVYSGAESCGVNDAFAVSGIDYGENDIHIRGLISVDVVTEKIESCGGCKGCGTKRSKPKRKRAKKTTPKATESLKA